MKVPGGLLASKAYRRAITGITLFTCCLCPVAMASAESVDLGLGGGEYSVEAQDPGWLQNEMRKIQEAVKSYDTERGASPVKSAPSLATHVLFRYPLRAAASLADFGFDGLSNFVDLDTRSGFKRDQQCGQRTYDGHDGTDFFLWPFPWYKVDNDQVEGVAAADGVIVAKGDGNQDRSCNFNNTSWNFVTLQHADGTYSVYGHFKNGSVTTKPVGATVSAGEPLGIIASSGNSTGPHLHFSVHDSNWNSIDPFSGPCSSATTDSWWIEQPTTLETRVNALLTHSAAPVIPACPQTETINAASSFKAGVPVYYAVYLRDENSAFAGTYTVYRPDGTVFNTWLHNKRVNYNASWWWWRWDLPTDAPPGDWRFELSFNGKTYSRPFRVEGNNYSLAVSKAGTGSGTITSDPAGIWCGTSCSASFAEGAIVTLTATTLADATFRGWSSDCSGFAPCLLAMTANKQVTANFGQGAKAKVSSTGYASLTDAYSAAGGNGTILVKGGLIAETLTMNQEKSVEIRGGYNSDFTAATGTWTILDGSLVLRNGRLSVNRLALR